jgi:peptidoglycan hydrolase-like protein with peptidoglycan-binding domain
MGLWAPSVTSRSPTNRLQVWEGVGNLANLTKGGVTLTITTVDATGSITSDPSFANGDRWGVNSSTGLVTERNIDVVMLNPNSTDLEARMNVTNALGSDGNGLIFDSLIGTQEGEVFAQVTSESHLPFSLPVPRTTNRSPLWFGSNYYPTWVNTSVVDPVTQETFFHWTLADGCAYPRANTVLYAPNASAGAPPPPGTAGTSQCIFIQVEPGQTTDWMDVGRMMDTLDHSSWNLPTGNYSLKLAVKDAETGAMVSLPGVYKGNPPVAPTAKVLSHSLGAKTSILIDANTRATRRTRDISDDFYSLWANLSATPVAHGKPPKHVMIAAESYPRGWPQSIGSTGTGVFDPKWDSAVRSFEKMYGLTVNEDPWPRNCTTEEQRQANCTTDFAIGSGNPVTFAALQSMVDGNAGTSVNGLDVDKTNMWMNFGDEIGLSGPEERYGPAKTNQSALNHAFEAYLESKDIAPAAAGCKPYVGCVYNTSLPVENNGDMASYYYSWRFSHDFGLYNASYNLVEPPYKNKTDTLKAFQKQTGKLPNAHTCANFPPSTGYFDTQHNLSRTKSYIPDVFMWVRAYREGTFTLPFTEDYIFQIAAGTQQCFDLVIDLERAGVRPKASALALAGKQTAMDVKRAPLKALPATATVPGRLISQYVMTHDPGNTPNSHRRRFYGGIAHGNKWIHLFEFQTFATGAGDFCDGYGGDGQHNGMYLDIRAQHNELGMWDDILAKGVHNAMGAKAAILFSETADIYYDDYGTPGSEKEALYITLRHDQIALDVVIEDDIVDGTINEYAVMYLTAAHVTQECGLHLAQWVKNGGTVFAAGGFGLLNETNQTNPVLAKLFGIKSHAVYGRGVGPGSSEISYIKQDLAFAEVLDTVTMTTTMSMQDSEGASALSVVGEKAILELDGTTQTSRHSGSPDAVLDDVSVPNVLATFGDKSPAVYKTTHGVGAAIVSAFPVGLSYFYPAMPIRPPARGNTDLTMNHFIPVDFAAAARDVVGLAVADVIGARPVLSSEPRIDIGVIAAAGLGTAVVVTNWTPEPLKALNLTLMFDVTYTHATLASGGNVEPKTLSSGAKSFVMDLDVADCLILR